MLCWGCSCAEKEDGQGLLWLLKTFQRPSYYVSLYIAVWSRLRQLTDSPLEAQLFVRWLRSCYLKQWGPWDLGDWAESFLHISRRYFLLFSIPISLFSSLTPSHFLPRSLPPPSFFLPQGTVSSNVFSHLSNLIYLEVFVKYCCMSTIYSSQDMDATQLSMDKWMNKEVVLHIHNRMLLSHKKEWIWVSSSEVDEPRACYTEWSKKEKNKYCILMRMYGI